jgi:Ni,Fe-hydrogenase III small subunit
MIQWVGQGIRTGIKTTAYPGSPESAPGVSPGLPLGTPPSPGAPRTEKGERQLESLVGCCPTQALNQKDGEIVVDYRRCVHCYRCERQAPTPLAWSHGYEWASANHSADPQRNLGKQFSRSIHILVVDAGDCGACLHEVKQLNNPYYNMHRLGFFLTPSPRHADVLLVVGPVTDHMRGPLQKTYDAMPWPKKVVAVGACALSGGVFGPSFVSEAGVAKIIPVDVEVPGQPPPPLAILHGLLVAVGHRPSTVLTSPPADSLSAVELFERGAR